MLNEEQHLLLCLAEEAVETAQAAIKCIRFTLQHRHLDYDTTNQENLLIEYTQMGVVMNLLEDKFIKNNNISLHQVHSSKLEAMEKYTGISQQMGVVEDFPCNYV